jgi:leucyl-tRNA synthetase
LRRQVHRAIAQVTEEIERLHFNKAVALVRELSNAVEAFSTGEGTTAATAAVLREAAETVVLLLGPMMPHLAEELWQRLGHDRLLAETAWPKADPVLLSADTVVVAVQVNGKRRAELRLRPGAPEAEAREAALADPAVLRAWPASPRAA